MKLLVGNSFHNTECQIEVIETYQAEGGWVAIVDGAEIARANRTLCGIADCICSGPHALEDKHGRVYLIMADED